MKKGNIIFIKIMIATTFSTALSLVMYGIFVPVIMNYDPEYFKEFFRKLMFNIALLEPLAMISVYLLYKPAHKYITKIEDKVSYTEKEFESAIKATKNIPFFLFLVGVSVYDIGIFIAFVPHFIKTGEIDLIHFGLRLVIGTIWGLLNGLLTARIISIFLIETKLKFELYESPKNIKRESHFLNIVIPLIILVMFLISVSIIIFYRYSVQNVDINLTKSNFNKIFFIYIFFFFLFSGIIYILIKESNEYLKNLSNQLNNMIQKETDLSAKIKITTFDDMGIISDKINKIIDKLTYTFKNIQTISNDVFLSNKKTQEDINESINFAKKLNEMIVSIEKNLNTQLLEMSNMLENFNNIINSSEESIVKNNEHIDYINTTSEAMKVILKSFDSLIDFTLRLDKEFNQFLNTIKKNNEQIRIVMNAINETNKTSLKINEIANVISDIASKTNLLSMNASIEAAHAGEYGKGFSVVADEIRKLSSNTSNSAKGITFLINEMNNKIKNSELLFDELIRSQKKLDENSKEIENLINDIAMQANSQISNAKESENKINILINNANDFKSNIIEQQNQFKKIKESIAMVTENVKLISENEKSLTNGIKEIIFYFDNIKEAFPQTTAYINRLKEEISNFKI